MTPGVILATVEHIRKQERMCLKGTRIRLPIIFFGYRDTQIDRHNENLANYTNTTKFSSHQTPNKFKKAIEISKTLGKGLNGPKNNVDNLIITEPLKPKQKLHLDTVTSGETEFCVKIKKKDIKLEELELPESICRFLKISDIEKLSPIQ
ncbi:hypothetical protein MXB_5209, partial [Myxobolus squamalis]